MINVLSYVGMSLQSEVCLWTLLGLVRTIFDATLFKVNANLKQVWQMNMPEELSRPLQRALRTMISGIMLVQCFTVYVYLASYIVLLYPVFLEERPTLVLPWLLLAAIRKLLCELTSLALGLGTCVLLGPARPPCIKFVVIKVISIMPSFYMWMLLYSYYHVLKVASVFKSFPAVLPPSEHDYGLELAVRRRRTKSLLKEEQLRTTLIANLYNERHSATSEVISRKLDYTTTSRMTHSTDTDAVEDVNEELSHLQPLTINSNRNITSDTGCYEDWFGSEIMVYRDTDRVLEQFGVMMLRIGAYLSKEGADLEPNSQIFNASNTMDARERVRDTIDSSAMPPDETETPPLVGSSQGKTASYLRDYPQIFMKKPSDMRTLSLASDEMMKQKNQYLNDDDDNATASRNLNVEDSAPDSEFLQKLNSKDTIQKKLQTVSSEKAVSFRQLKLKPTLQGINSDDNEVNDRSMQSDTCVNNDKSQEQEADSLQSIIDKIEARGSTKEKSLTKDEIKLDTQSASSSRARDKSDVKTETSATTVVSNEVGNNTSNLSISIKLENKNKQNNKDNKNETK